MANAFDDLFDKTNSLYDLPARTFLWGLVSPVLCKCGTMIERDEPRFEIGVVKGRSGLFAYCTCGTLLRLGFTGS